MGLGHKQVIKMLMMPISFVCSRRSRGEWLLRTQTPAMKKNENPLNEISYGRGVFSKPVEMAQGIGQTVDAGVRGRGSAFRLHDCTADFPG